MSIGRNALYFDDYILSIQYFNQVIGSKPYLAEPYFFRAVAKLNLDDFRGAEEDCTSCLERNPFYIQAYKARAIARQNMNNLMGAVEDYDRTLAYMPEDKQMLTNKAIALIQLKEYDLASQCFERLFKLQENNVQALLVRGNMYLEKGDTINAMNDFDKAIKSDRFYAPAYASRGILNFQKEDFTKALDDLNEAIRLEPRQWGYYINRGLVRYHLNDLRGSMSDYDHVVEAEPDNLIARFNRGLLRAQVGDNNRAIGDFDRVILLEPDNYMAIYNRALLRSETGDISGAIADIDKVIKEYPNFIPGYYDRSRLKRQLGDVKGAEKDYWLAFDIEQDLKNKKKDSLSSTAEASSGNDDKTREQSDKNINKFNRLVVYDKDAIERDRYQSSLRGRVQDRNVDVDLEPLFLFTYYKELDEVERKLPYTNVAASMNKSGELLQELLITNNEVPLSENLVAQHFKAIDDYSKKIEAHPNDALLVFGRGMEFMLVQDFQSAQEDFEKAMRMQPNNIVFLMNHAALRYKQLSISASENEDDKNSMSVNLRFGPGKHSAQTDMASKFDRYNYEFEMILRDYNRIIEIAPDFVYAYFNRGNIHSARRNFKAAIADYSEAIRRDDQFADAYFNRGLTRIYLGDTQRGIEDLSKAGELGLVNAYSIIKRIQAD
ncbi:MAG: tetratricopeptide repeat protein [Bacteroidales bacterium]|nr:tetratricopeptide repeat protein [Bacteroidales bacterium]